MFSDNYNIPKSGRIIAIDPGTKRIGIAVCDELWVRTRPLPIIKRTSWKNLLSEVINILNQYDAVALVIGLPYNFDGTESDMSANARDLARKFTLSLQIPVYLQDERATTYEARARLWQNGIDNDKIGKTLDSEAAAIILADFIDRVKH